MNSAYAYTLYGIGCELGAIEGMREAAWILMGRAREYFETGNDERAREYRFLSQDLSTRADRQKEVWDKKRVPERIAIFRLLEEYDDIVEAVQEKTDHDQEG